MIFYSIRKLVRIHFRLQHVSILCGMLSFLLATLALLSQSWITVHHKSQPRYWREPSKFASSSSSSDKMSTTSEKRKEESSRRSDKSSSKTMIEINENM